jgi:ABC-type antimicrobial peptide transport system permease subunit
VAGAFGLLGVLLACIGLYGLLAHSVRERTRESGVRLALGLTLRGLLYGLSRADPLTFVAVAALLVAVATLAIWHPARRASRVDPVHALRHS